jgi:hypothetical protein
MPSPKPQWPKEIVVCLECGKHDLTDFALRDLSSCSGEGGDHGPTQKVSVVPISEVEGLVGVRFSGYEKLKEEVRPLWEAATVNWPEDDDEGVPIPLGELLFDSATALPGIPIKGKDLYRIGVALGFIEEMTGE